MPRLAASENLPILERIPSTPPVIAPVASHIQRPQWSVMIPAYNCLPYLRDTIESVLAQDPGPAHMQIVVVDDCSTDGDVRGLVQAVGKNRVEYLLQPANVGSLRNFETCLNYATGHWVHLLHGDDQAGLGFYTEIASLFQQYPEAGAAFTNTIELLTQVTGSKTKTRVPLIPKAGLIPDFLLQLAEGQKLETPSIVVRRSVYEQLGGFFAVHYGEDWEMWTRIAAHFPIAYSPKPLARYRYLNTTGISHRFIKDGQNLRDVTKIIAIINQYLPAELRKELKARALRYYAAYSLTLAEALIPADKDAALTQIKGALRMSSHVTILYWSLKVYLKHLASSSRTKPAPQ
jgi:glycosyltransferase involved in cell wall biosynthesis